MHRPPISLNVRDILIKKAFFQLIFGRPSFTKMDNSIQHSIISIEFIIIYNYYTIINFINRNSIIKNYIINNCYKVINYNKRYKTIETMEVKGCKRKRRRQVYR